MRSPVLDAAFRSVRRHLFLPGCTVGETYKDTSVSVKRDAAGTTISAATQPSMVATILEYLDPRPGDRVLALGTGPGYSAALAGVLVGPAGHVTTIDVDEGLVTAARQHLAAAGAGNVEVIRADGALRHRDGAPYDRIIATVDTFDIPATWLDQLAPGGRLVVPLRLRGGTARSIACERATTGDRWVSRDSEAGVFTPMRGGRGVLDGLEGIRAADIGYER